MKHDLVLSSLVSVCCVSISMAQQGSTTPANLERFPPPDSVIALERYPLVAPRSDLGEVLVEDEAKLIRQSMAGAEEVIRLRAEKNPKNLGRGDHAKPLGCYRAEFTVSPEVRPEDRAGIAKAENLGKTFLARVRFSNSEPKDVSDYRSATVGLAVKVTLDPATHAGAEFLFPGKTEQDFVAGGLDDTFVSPHIAKYAELFWLRIHPFSNALAIRQGHPEAFEVFGTEPLLRVFRLSSNAAPMVLEKPFSSLVPYAWGDRAVKFRFEPCHDFRRAEASFSRFDSDYQAKVIANHLKSSEICYRMKIQPRPRPRSDEDRHLIDKTFPIEDALVRWPDSGGPNDPLSAEFREVARVRIEKGSQPMADADCEHLAFNPWNGLKAHQPLGSLNRARLAVYKKSEVVRKTPGFPPTADPASKLSGR